MRPIDWAEVGDGDLIEMTDDRGRQTTGVLDDVEHHADGSISFTLKRTTPSGRPVTHGIRWCPSQGTEQA